MVLYIDSSHVKLRKQFPCDNILGTECSTGENLWHKVTTNIWIKNLLNTELIEYG